MDYPSKFSSVWVKHRVLARRRNKSWNAWSIFAVEKTRTNLVSRGITCIKMNEIGTCWTPTEKVPEQSQQVNGNRSSSRIHVIIMKSVADVKWKNLDMNPCSPLLIMRAIIRVARACQAPIKKSQLQNMNHKLNVARIITECHRHHQAGQSRR